MYVIQYHEYNLKDNSIQSLFAVHISSSNFVLNDKHKSHRSNDNKVQGRIEHKHD